MIRKIQKLFLRLIKELNAPPPSYASVMPLENWMWICFTDPPFISKARNTGTAVGQRGILQCEASAVPKADFEWYKEDRRQVFLIFFLRCFLWARNSLKSILKTHKDCCGVRAFKSIWNKPDDVVSPDQAAALCTYWCFKWGFPFDEARWCFIGWFSVSLCPKCSFLKSLKILATAAAWATVISFMHF